VVVLLLLTFLLNGFAVVLRYRMRSKFAGANA
jgi:hypothetical protein